MSRTTHRQRVTVSAYLVTALTLLGLGGEVLVPGHHVHVGDPAGHHHHFFTGPHHHQDRGPSRDAFAALDGVGEPTLDASRRELGEGRTCHPDHESTAHESHPRGHGHGHGNSHSHSHGHEHGHPHAHDSDHRQGQPRDDTPAEPRGPPVDPTPRAASTEASTDGTDAAAQLASERPRTAEPSRAPAHPEHPDPAPDSTPDTALIDSGFSLDDPTPRRAAAAPLPRPTAFHAIAGPLASDSQQRRPGGARAPPSTSLV